MAMCCSRSRWERTQRRERESDEKKNSSRVTSFPSGQHLDRALLAIPSNLPITTTILASASKIACAHTCVSRSTSPFEDPPCRSLPRHHLVSPLPFLQSFYRPFLSSPAERTMVFSVPSTLPRHLISLLLASLSVVSAAPYSTSSNGGGGGLGELDVFNNSTAGRINKSAKHELPMHEPHIKFGDELFFFFIAAVVSPYSFKN